MRKVLYVAAEAVPFVKTGGLADVAGSLPVELAAKGVDVRVVLPEYKDIKEKYSAELEHVFHGELELAWRHKYFGIDRLCKDGVTWYFIDNDDYFSRDDLYGYWDDAERFAYFCRAVLLMLPEIDFWPDIIHTNDWHSALINMLLRVSYHNDERYARIKTIFTIHNLKYQGIFGREIVEDVLALDNWFFNKGDLEFNGAVNYMKGGLVYADYITTVSRTYAWEIQYSYYGEGLEGLLKERQNSLFGIVNGIDYSMYDPQTNADIVKNYSVETFENKRDNRVALQRELGLPEDRTVPMVALVSRLTEQKGIDLIVRIIDELLLHEEMQFVMLGNGDKEYEDWFRELAWRFPTKVSANIGFSNALAQRVYASASMLLMPSRYEPCGISQLIAMHYGTIPIVRETGGLSDTVQSYDKYTEKGTGFVFPNYNAHELMFAIKKALACFRRDDGFVWKNIVRNAMQADFSWNKSAEEYIKLYERLISR